MTEQTAKDIPVEPPVIPTAQGSATLKLAVKKKGDALTQDDVAALAKLPVSEILAWREMDQSVSIVTIAGQKLLINKVEA